jgi:hypothetical protein
MMRRVAIGLMLFTLGCVHDASHESGPLSPVDGGIYGLVSTSDGGLPVVLDRSVEPTDGSTLTQYLIAERITFVYGSGRVLRDITSSQVSTSPDGPPETHTGTLEQSGIWSQVGDKVIITTAVGFPGSEVLTLDTLSLVNGELHGHMLRPSCAGCGSTLEVVFVRGATP